MGRDVVIVSQATDEIVLEGAVRLRPGMVIEVVAGYPRSATVLTWLVSRLGRDGTVYRGRCRWVDPVG